LQIKNSEMLTRLRPAPARQEAGMLSSMLSFDAPRKLRHGFHGLAQIGFGPRDLGSYFAFIAFFASWLLGCSNVLSLVCFAVNSTVLIALSDIEQRNGDKGIVTRMFSNAEKLTC
jgi:hypothetical protein